MLPWYSRKVDKLSLEEKEKNSIKFQLKKIISILFTHEFSRIIFSMLFTC